MQKLRMQFLLVLLGVSVVFSLTPCNFCEIPSCEPESHTLCIFGIEDVSWERCVSFIRLSLTLAEKTGIVNLHNYFRTQVFNGNESRGRPGPQPAAPNVTFLEWDEELELAAHVWALQCPDYEDECRNVVRFLVNQSVGTNRTRGHLSELSIDGILWSWYNEVEKFNSTEVSSYSVDSAELWSTYHYTQMVWESTEKIGCAQVKYRVENEYILTIVCNYGPRGNNMGESIYTIKQN